MLSVPDIGVISLGPEAYDDAWQTRHEIMSRLALHFRVVWLEPQLPWQHALSAWRRQRDVRSLRMLPAGLSIRPPEIWFPYFFRSAALQRLAFAARLRRARRALVGAGCTRIVLYIWRPAFAGALDLVNHDFSVYHIDDEYSFSTIDEPVSPAEHALIERVDQVFIHSPALMHKKGRINPHTAAIPNGVAYHDYATPHAEPKDLSAISRPRVGYAGYLKKHLDWQLLRDIARARPQWHLVFVGPVSPNVLTEHLAELRLYPNVHFLGARPPRALPSYIQHFDVCLLPYVRNAYTKYIYPLKVHQYLAAGKVTLGSPIDSLLPLHDVIILASTPDEWLRRLDQALASCDDQLQVCKRRRVAMAHDWDALVWRIARRLTHAVHPVSASAIDAHAPPLATFLQIDAS